MGGGGNLEKLKIEEIRVSWIFIEMEELDPYHCILTKIFLNSLIFS